MRPVCRCLPSFTCACSRCDVCGAVLTNLEDAMFGRGVCNPCRLKEERMTTMKAKTFADLPAETKAFARESYIGNECDTDQYRETQPEAGLGVIAALVGILSEKTAAQAFELDETLIGEETRRELLLKVFTLAAAWTVAAQGAYEGADDLRPILAIYFDVLWARNEHPYYDLGEFIDFHVELGDLDEEGNIVS